MTIRFNVNHSSNGKFAPGNRANPQGWKRVERYRKALRRAISPEAVERVLVVLLRLAEEGNLEAIKIVLDRVMGKAVETVEINDRTEITIRLMSDQELLSQFQSELAVKPVDGKLLETDNLGGK